MERIPVTSALIASVGYDDSAQILELEFVDGSVYQYSNVSNEIMHALMSASSKGVFFNKNIVGVYSYRRLI